MTVSVCLSVCVCVCVCVCVREHISLPAFIFLCVTYVRGSVLLAAIIKCCMGVEQVEAEMSQFGAVAGCSKDYVELRGTPHAPPR